MDLAQFNAMTTGSNGMKLCLNSLRANTFIALALAVWMFVAGSAAAAPPSVDESELLASGFRVLVATTSVQKEWVQNLPRGQIRPMQPTGKKFFISSEARENIRTGVAKIVHEGFVKELQNKGSYKVVDEIGPDVLRVKTYIANLYVSAPDTGTAAISRTCTVSAGEMTLVGELYDSETGQILARVVDRREARRVGTLMLTNSATNAEEARSTASAWARILRSGLDRAHGIGKK
jgi:hypothetical protein